MMRMFFHDLLRDFRTAVIARHQEAVISHVQGEAAPHDGQADQADIQKLGSGF